MENFTKTVTAVLAFVARGESPQTPLKNAQFCDLLSWWETIKFVKHLL